jgi:hypothetical protein
MSMVLASILMMLLPITLTMLTAQAQESPKETYICNDKANAKAECSFIASAGMSNTTLSTTQIATSALPLSISIRITIAPPIPSFDNLGGAKVELNGGNLFQTTLVTETDRVAQVTVPITSVAPGQTQTIIFLNVSPRLSSEDDVEGYFIVNHGSAPPIRPSTSPTSYVPLVVRYRCFVFDSEDCFGPNETFSNAINTTTNFPVLLNQEVKGVVSHPDDQRDFYRVPITDARPHTISINATGPTISNGDLDLYLYNPQQQIVCRSSFIGTSFEFVRIAVRPCSNSAVFSNTLLPAGTYVLEVRYGFSGQAIASTVPYTLFVTP